MKIRLGFVANSSSSSFVFTLPKFVDSFEKFKYFIAGYITEKDINDAIVTNDIEVLDMVDISKEDLDVLYRDVCNSEHKEISLDQVSRYVDIDNVVLHISNESCGSCLQYDITDEIVSNVLHKDPNCAEWSGIVDIIRENTPNILADKMIDILDEIYGMEKCYDVADDMIRRYIAKKIDKTEINLSDVIILEYGNCSSNTKGDELEHSQTLKKHPLIFSNFNH